MAVNEEYVADDQRQDDQPSGDESSFKGDLLDDVILEIGEFTKIGAGLGKQTKVVVPDEFSPSDDDLDEANDDSEEADGKKDEKADSDNEGDEESAKKGETSTVRHLKKKIDGLQRRLSKMEKTEEKPEGKPEEQLTEEQLLQIMHEHEGEPEVLLNVMKYIQKQGLKDSEKNAAEAAKIKSIASQADTYLSGVFDGYGSDEFFSDIDETFPLEDWGLKGHPLARQIQSGLALAGAFKSVLEREVKKAKGTQVKIEEKRKEAIVQRGGLPKPKEKAPPETRLDERSARVANEIGLTSPSQRKLYASFLKKGK